MDQQNEGVVMLKVQERSSDAKISGRKMDQDPSPEIFTFNDVLKSKRSSMTLYEGEDEFLLTANLKGCRKSDLGIHFGCETLMLSGYHKSREEKFEKCIHFDVPIQKKGMRAWFEKNLLLVGLPKVKGVVVEGQAKGRAIPSHLIEIIQRKPEMVAI